MDYPQAEFYERWQSRLEKQIGDRGYIEMKAVLSLWLSIYQGKS